MYKIFADDICIYDDASPLQSVKVISPSLSLSDNAAGTLTLTVPPMNAGYSSIQRTTTDIVVYKDGTEYWAGRVLDENKDFWNNRVLTCEGELAFLNDTIQPPAEYHDQTVRGFLETLISIHNAKVSENRQFTVGSVTVTDSNDSIYRYTNYETTLECINEKLIDKLGGHIRIRKSDGVRYIDYLADYPNTNTQKIEFGVNLTDFVRKWDSDEFATVIVPLGNRLDESDIEALEAYLTVESANDGSIYVTNDSAVEQYGWIEVVVNWDDVSTAENLLTKAKEYLSNLQFDNMTIELSAVDLHYLDVDYEAVKLLDKIRVISTPHGMDRYFPVSKLDIPLDSPESTVFTLGDDIKTSYTSITSKESSEIKQQIENLPTEQAILTEAKANATALLTSATNGYITITTNENGSEALYISDTQDYTQATRLWVANINGIGYSSDGGKTFELAMTMDGAIVADFITVGTLNGELLKADSVKATAISQEFKDTITDEISDAADTVKETVTQSFKAADAELKSEITTEYTGAISSNYTKTQTLISQTQSSILSTVSKAASKYNTDSYDISYYGYGTPNESGLFEFYILDSSSSAILDSSGNPIFDSNENSSVSAPSTDSLYLDQSTGKLYAYDGNGSWYDKSVTLSLITDELSSSITQTKDEIELSVSETYATKTELSETQSLITQTQTSILATVSGSVSKYNTGKQTINYYGYGTPEESGQFSSTPSTNTTYLDQSTGYLWVWTGSTWYHATSYKLITDELSASIELKVNTDDLISEINASADVITLTSGRLVITSGQLQLDSSGNATFSGSLSAATGTFKGTLSAASGSFTGTVTTTSGNYTTQISGGLISCSYSGKQAMTAGIYSSSYATQYCWLASYGTDGIALGIKTSSGGCNTYIRINDNDAMEYEECRLHFIGTVKFDDQIKSNLDLYNSNLEFDSNYGIKWGGNMGLRYYDEGSIDGIHLGITGTYACPLVLSGTKLYFSFSSPATSSLNFETNYGIQWGGNTGIRYYQTSSTSGLYVGITANSCATHIVGGSIYLDATTYGTLSSSSDERLKTDIVDVDDKYVSLLDEIKPKTFRYKEERLADKINLGFIAQNVIASMKESGIDVEELGIVVDCHGDGSEYALNYTQFIPIMWKILQNQQAKINSLERSEST